MGESGEHNGIVPFEYIEAEEDAGHPALIVVGNKIHVYFPNNHRCTFEIKEDGLAYMPSVLRKFAPTGNEIKKARVLAKADLKQK